MQPLLGRANERVGVGRCGFEVGRVADGAGRTRPAPDAALPVRQKTRRGREDAVLPEPSLLQEKRGRRPRLKTKKASRRPAAVFLFLLSCVRD
jgi:hypothetical protein